MRILCLGNENSLYFNGDIVGTKTIKAVSEIAF